MPRPVDGSRAGAARRLRRRASGGKPAPSVPDSLRAPANQSVALALDATGVQIYTCGPDQDAPAKFVWIFKAPDAELFDDRRNKVGKHYAGPTSGRQRRQQGRRPGARAGPGTGHRRDCLAAAGRQNDLGIGHVRPYREHPARQDSGRQGPRRWLHGRAGGPGGAGAVYGDLLFLCRHERIVDVSGAVQENLLGDLERARELFADGLARHVEQNWAEAEQLYRQALHLAPDRPSVVFNLGRLMLDQQKDADAEAWFRRSLELAPDHESSYNLAVCLARQGKFESALAPYDQAIALAPGTAAAHAGRGWVLEQLGRPAEALESHARSVELAPELADLQVAYCRCAALAGAAPELRNPALLETAVLICRWPPTLMSRT